MRVEQTGNNRVVKPLASRVLILLLMMVLSFGLFATSRVVRVVEQIDKEQTSQNLQLAKTTTGVIDSRIDAAGQILIPVAGQKDIRTQNYAATSKWMQWFVAKYPDYCLAAFVDANGKIKALGVSDKLMENESAWKIAVSNVAQFAKTITANDVKVGNFKYSQIAKTSVVNLGYPVFDYASKRVGVIVITLDLTGIQNRITQSYNGSSNHVLMTVVDEKGFTIARSAELNKFIGDITPNTNYILKTMTRLKEGSAKGDFTEGISNSIAFSSATKIPWFVYVGTETGFIQGQIKDEVTNLIIGFVPLMLIAVFGLWWIGHSTRKNDVASAQPLSVDSVTGLWDSSKLLDDLRKEYERAKRYRQQLSFSIIRINHFDHFKDVNGRKSADDALGVMAQIVNNMVRGTDMVYRYSNDEICVLLPSTDKVGAEYMAKRIVKEVQECSFDGEEKQPYGKLTVSIGISTYPFDSISTEGLIKCADVALSGANGDGASTFESYGNTGTTIYAVDESQSQPDSNCG